ncbi:MAG: ribbon-helix-helix protein, CopG family [Candidatus Eremiobacteraeota bacterium]|nr:ribbon-helix-helix protein, CopG family [Candidatus Eremiobacteraeota bacterium]
MISPKKKTDEEAIAELERSQPEKIAAGERIRSAPPGSTELVSVRLSKELLARIDHIADLEHRKRSNLIRHVLWDFVIARGFAGLK